MYCKAVTWKVGCVSLIGYILLSVSSCVPESKFTEEQNKRKNCESELAKVQAADQDCEAKKTELAAQVDMMQKEIAGLVQDTANSGVLFREGTQNYMNLQQQNNDLLDKYNKLISSNETESKRISGALQATQSQLLEKEDQLNKLQDQLNKQKYHLDSLSAQLQSREAKVNELENIMHQKDAAVDTLKQRMENALLGFAGKGISVYEKNGKVYVSMQEALLFPTGSIKVQPGGLVALQQVARALAANPGINVMVEGHTDDVPMHGNGQIKDNWDLSVMRATAIVKILLQDANIDPRRLMASGVSQYDPVDNADTPEGKQKNRRTDIILTPQLNELFQILNAQ